MTKSYHRMFRPKRTSPAAVLIYMLLIFGVMGTLFALILSVFNANNTFSRRVFNSTRLNLENQSVTGQIFALYQNNPRHPKLTQYANPRRTVDYAPYASERGGYLYPGKTDTVTVDARKYPDQSALPSSLTISNDVGSSGTLNVISRLVRLDTGFIQSSSFTQIAAPTGATPTAATINLPGDLTGGEQRFTSKWELLLFSDQNALYTLTPPSTQKLLATTLNISIASKNNSIIGTDQTMIASENAFALEPNSLFFGSATDFTTSSTGTAFISSPHQPGISSAFLDNFDAWSQKNWNTMSGGPIAPPNGGTLTIPSTNTQMEFVVNNLPYTFSGDFDIRAVMENTSPTPGTSAGIYADDTASSTTYRASVAAKTHYIDTSGSCVAAGNETGYMAYQGSEPTDFSDGSSVCATAHPAASTRIPFAPTGSTYTLRLERRNGQLNAFYCEWDEDNCDRSDSFLVINTQPVAFASTGVKVGLYTNGAELKVRSMRLASISPSTALTYNKTVTFEKATTIKKVSLIGYIPASSAFNVKLTDTGACASNCTTDYGNQTTIIPSNLKTNSVKIELSFKSISGDLSEILFIHGIRIEYE